MEWICFAQSSKLYAGTRKNINYTFCSVRYRKLSCMSKYPIASHDELASREVTMYGIAKIDAVDALAQTQYYYY